MKRLFRSKTNHVLGGVCGGLGEYFEIDPVLIRLVWLILILFGGVGLVLYVIAWAIIPLEEVEQAKHADIKTPITLRGHLWWGLVLVIMGVFLLGSQYRIIYWPIIPGIHLHTRDFVPLVLMLVGLYLVYSFGRRASHMDRPGKQRLYRSRSDRKLLGVCGGLADYFQIDSTLIRVLWVAGSFLYGIGVLLYIVLVLALPDQPAVETTVSKKAKG